MSESGVSRRTESEVDNDEMRGNRGGSASSPSAPSLKKGKGGRKVVCLLFSYFDLRMVDVKKSN